jgi:hypothetical protein
MCGRGNVKRLDYKKKALILPDRPVCQIPEHQTELGVPEGGNVTVTCVVSADPPVTRFRWWFNAGESLMESVADDFSHDGTSSSSMIYS